jgi:hypothetical protein
MPAATFASPTTGVWNHVYTVYCLAKCKDGNCKEMKCKYCDGVYTGGRAQLTVAAAAEASKPFLDLS